MLVIAVENAPPRLRGRLAVWLLEIRAGIYIGDYSQRTRATIWEQVVAEIGPGDAIMAWTAPNEAGYDFATIGENRRMPWDIDGFKLVRFRPPREASLREPAPAPTERKRPERDLAGRKREKSALDSSTDAAPE